MNTDRTLMLVASVWLLTACQMPPPPPAEASAAGISSSDNRAAAEASRAMSDDRCPAQELNAFVSAFADRVELQKQFTAQPLQMDSLDATAEPEPRQMSREVLGDEIPFPVMPNTAQQRKQGLEMEVGQVRDGEAEVVLQKPDTGYRLSFLFRKDACWTLYRVSDDSL